MLFYYVIKYLVDGQLKCKQII